MFASGVFLNHVWSLKCPMKLISEENVCFLCGSGGKNKRLGRCANIFVLRNGCHNLLLLVSLVYKSRGESSHLPVCDFVCHKYICFWLKYNSLSSGYHYLFIYLLGGIFPPNKAQRDIAEMTLRSPVRQL